MKRSARSCPVVFLFLFLPAWAADEQVSPLDKNLASAAEEIAANANLVGNDAPVVVILDFVAIDGLRRDDRSPEDARFTEFGAYLAGTFAVFLGKRNAQVRTQADVDAVLAVQGDTLKAEGLYNSKSIVRIGKVVGARVIVRGETVDTGEGVRIFIRVLDVETAKTLAQTHRDVRTEEIPERFRDGQRHRSLRARLREDISRRLAATDDEADLDTLLDFDWGEEGRHVVDSETVETIPLVVRTSKRTYLAVLYEDEEGLYLLMGSGEDGQFRCRWNDALPIPVGDRPGLHRLTVIVTKSDLFAPLRDKAWNGEEIQIARFEEAGDPDDEAASHVAELLGLLDQGVGGATGDGNKDILGVAVESFTVN